MKDKILNIIAYAVFVVVFSGVGALTAAYWLR